MRPWSGIILVLFMVCASCTQYTPKPRGYFRIEPDSPRYYLFSKKELPYAFHVSQLVVPEIDMPARGIVLSYPELKAKVYCNYVAITPSTLGKVVDECRTLVVRQSMNVAAVKEQVYDNPAEHVYGSLFLLEEGAASPLQFMLTDSVSRFIRGALYYDCTPNADSLAPVNHYLKQDIIELIQSFHWEK